MPGVKCMQLIFPMHIFNDVGAHESLKNEFLINICMQSDFNTLFQYFINKPKYTK